MQLEKNSWSVAVLLVATQVAMMFTLMVVVHLTFGETHQTLEPFACLLPGMVLNPFLKQRLTTGSWSLRPPSRF